MYSMISANLLANNALSRYGFQSFDFTLGHTSWLGGYSYIDKARKKNTGSIPVVVAMIYKLNDDNWEENIGVSKYWSVNIFFTHEHPTTTLSKANIFIYSNDGTRIKSTTLEENESLDNLKK